MYNMMEWRPGGWGNFFLTKILHKAAETYKVYFFNINKYVGKMVFMNDLECDLL